MNSTSFSSSSGEPSPIQATPQSKGSFLSSIPVVKDITKLVGKLGWSKMSKEEKGYLIIAVACAVIAIGIFVTLTITLGPIGFAMAASIAPKLAVISAGAAFMWRTKRHERTFIDMPEIRKGADPQAAGVAWREKLSAEALLNQKEQDLAIANRLSQNKRIRELGSEIEDARKRLEKARQNFKSFL